VQLRAALQEWLQVCGWAYEGCNLLLLLLLLLLTVIDMLHVQVAVKRKRPAGPPRSTHCYSWCPDRLLLKAAARLYTCSTVHCAGCRQ
jgi:hypothetical protein